MKLEDVNGLILSPGLSLLPAHMDSQAARAMLLTIGLQESRFTHRAQVRGPARGFWQFEVIGTREVIINPLVTRNAREVMARLQYASQDAVDLHRALQHNDILAAAFARLLLWRLPHRLPTDREPVKAWEQYLEAWRPGKPHSHTWEGFYQRAWRFIQTGDE